MFSIQELIADHRTGQDNFQDDYFVTEKHGITDFGKYKQSLRQLYQKIRGLRQSYFLREKSKIDIDELKNDIESGETNVFESRRKEIDYKDKILGLGELEVSIKNDEREAKRYYQQACYFKEKLGDLTEKNRKQMEQDLWIKKMKRVAAIELVTQGRVQNNTYDSILSFPVEIRNDILKSVGTTEGRKELVESFEKREEELTEEKLEKYDVDIQKVLTSEINSIKLLQ